MKPFTCLGVLVLAVPLSGCGTLALFSDDPDEAAADAQRNEALVAAANDLMELDRAFAARSLEAGPAQAFADFMDEQSARIPISGDPILGRDEISRQLAEGDPFVLAWEPRYAEVFAPGDWGWTWGEWKAYEPGAGGRRVSRGKYINIWRRLPDGSWKVRIDMGSEQRDP